MSRMALHVLVGTALTDPDFCDRLLNGGRPTLLAEFDLTAEEREAVLPIEAGSLSEFATRLEEWLAANEQPDGGVRPCEPPADTRARSSRAVSSRTAGGCEARG
jgi:hypothetical protein